MYGFTEKRKISQHSEGIVKSEAGFKEAEPIESRSKRCAQKTSSKRIHLSNGRQETAILDGTQ